MQVPTCFLITRIVFCRLSTLIALEPFAIKTSNYEYKWKNRTRDTFTAFQKHSIKSFIRPSFLYSYKIHKKKRRFISFHSTLYSYSHTKKFSRDLKCDEEFLISIYFLDLVINRVRIEVRAHNSVNVDTSKSSLFFVQKTTERINNFKGFLYTHL